MLRYFRINDPYRLVGLFILVLLIYLPFFVDTAPVTEPELRSMLVGEKVGNGSQMYVEVADNTAPLAAWFHALIYKVFDRSLLARHILAFFIIFFQSAYFGIVLITKKVFNENTFIPSLLFSLLYCFSFDTLALSDELIGSGFLLLAMNNLFKEIEFRMPRDETSFNLGVYISFASLFFLAYSIFLAAVLVILFLFARSTGRKVMLLVFGFLLPHLVVLTISYLNGGITKIVSYFYLTNISFNNEPLMSVKGLLVLGIIPGLFLTVSIVMLNRLARFSKYQAELLQSIFLWGGFCFIYFLFCPNLRPQSLVVLIPPMAVLLTHFLLLIRRKKFAEMNIWLLLIGIVSISYMARYAVIGSVDYTRLLVEGQQQKLYDGKKILVLDHRPALMLHSGPATPFINWQIAEPLFSEPEYYESVTEVYTGLKNDPPDIIVDQSDLMRPFLERIPELKRAYRREGENYVKRISN